MKYDTAKAVIDTSIEINGMLDRCLARVKAEEPEEVFEDFRRVIAGLSGSLLVDVVRPLCEQHPNLTPEQLKRSE